MRYQVFETEYGGHYVFFTENGSRWGIVAGHLTAAAAAELAATLNAEYAADDR